MIAGGRGLRLGGVLKAALRLPDGRTLLSRTLDELGPLFEEVLVAAVDPAQFPGLRVVQDPVPDRGAPGGVLAACAGARTPWLFAVASDMPAVSAAVVRRLWERRGDAAAVLATLDGRAEPLHAFYRAVPCAAAFEPLLRERGRSFGELLAGVETSLVPVEELGPSARESFLNVNDPAALSAAGVRLPEGRPPGGEATKG